jgi:hypothetical protein
MPIKYIIIIEQLSIDKWRLSLKESNFMVKCGICGGKAPRQPGITEEGTCDLCGKKVMLADDCLQKK